MKKILLYLMAAQTTIAFGQTISDHTTLLSKFQSPNASSYSDIWGYAAAGREYAFLGCYEGTSIIDVTDPASPVEVAFISGPHSIWRDIKTHSHYAYVTHDANDNSHPNPGVQIIDLSPLPATAMLAGTYNATIQDGLAHNLYIDDGYAYIAGSRNVGGAHILDLTDPTQPVEVGAWVQNYWHDVIVKNDTLYGSGMFAGTIEIVDGRDKSNLSLISRTFFPDAFTHNIWM
ncbi:MAG: choice-of-anchor B family protein, partial [Anaerolineae bacterium]|nr:choice-of-anchor B family protein [Anaerolineae bacterium]